MEQGNLLLLSRLRAMIKDSSLLSGRRKYDFLRQIRLLWENREGDEQRIRNSETSLSRLLNKGNPDERFFAFCLLTKTSWLQKATLKQIVAFRADPRNQQIINRAEVQH